MTEQTKLKFNRKNFFGIAIAVLLVLAAFFAAKINSDNKAEPEIKPQEVRKTTVQTERVSPTEHSPLLSSTASVVAWQESQLAAQVGGRLEWICDCLETGNKVKKDTVLAKIEAVDYLVAVAQAKQALADAKQRIAEEKARAEQARADWEQLNLGEPSDLALRKPQLLTANANLNRRTLELQQANRNLKRTQIRAPYDGIITARMTNVGNFISTGATIGTILNTDKVQIHFALNPTDINKLDSENSEIILTQSSNQNLKWPAKIERIDSVIDPRTRLVNIIAEVEKPFDTELHAKALRVGTFVTTEFAGKTIANVYSLPSSAVLADKSVYTVNSNKQIKVFNSELIHRNPNSVLVAIPEANLETINVITRGQGAYSEGLTVDLANNNGGE